MAQDIEAVDPEYYKNLRWMLENDIGDVLDLTFTEEVDYFGAVELVELKPGGAKLRAVHGCSCETCGCCPCWAMWRGAVLGLPTGMSAPLRAHDTSALPCG